MTQIHLRIFAAMVSLSLLTTVIITLKSPPARVSGAFTLRGKQNNPDAFYLSATGKIVTYGFIYDPHAADDWSFSTAEGALVKSGVSQIAFDQKPEGK